MLHLRYLAAAAVAAVAVAGCGSSSSKPTSSSAPAPAAAPASTSASASSSSAAAAPSSAASLAVSADPGGALKFSTASLRARAGTVQIAFTNQSPEGHNLTIAGSSGQLVGATPTFTGGKHTLSVHLKPGTYTFFCSVPGHRMAGMQGTLVVS